MTKRKAMTTAEAGRLGGKQRAKNLTADEASAVARQGGSARAARLTPEQRKAIGRAAAAARWAKRKARQPD